MNIISFLFAKHYLAIFLYEEVAITFDETLRPLLKLKSFLNKYFKFKMLLVN